MRNADKIVALEKEPSMADEEEIAEIERRIAAIQENIRTLVEQAAAYSGAADETRNADRIAEQEDLLAELQKQKTDLEK
jgi:hypothetical protein